ncbi:MAG: hypothetical protein ACD_8C00037G0001 [uncultured bacterium]|nr:MAG: hypothetical protein ACD_8C00037G0001 [uncultured bacterium]
MRKFFFIVVLAGFAFLIGGCATIALPSKNIETLTAPEKSEREEAIERFNMRVARAFAEFKCPERSSFEYLEKSLGFAVIFDSNESRAEWVRKIHYLAQDLSGGTVNVGEIRSTQKYGLYNETEEFYLLVFSASQMREYAFRKKGNSISCAETKRERFVRELTGG